LNGCVEAGIVIAEGLEQHNIDKKQLPRTI